MKGQSWFGSGASVCSLQGAVILGQVTILTPASRFDCPIEAFSGTLS